MFEKQHDERILTNDEKSLLSYLKEEFDKYADDEYKAGYLACMSEVEYFLKYGRNKNKGNGAS